MEFSDKEFYSAIKKCRAEKLYAIVYKKKNNSLTEVFQAESKCALDTFMNNNRGTYIIVNEDCIGMGVSNSPFTHDGLICLN